MKKILLHICCGPCATATVKKLKEEGFLVTGFFYNPNIHPNWEYKKRLKEAKKLALNNDIKLIIAEYQPVEYFNAICGFEEKKSNRCLKCWELRIEATAKKAVELGIGNIATTLRISPYQDQPKLLKLLEKITKEYGIDFYQNELTECFRDSIKISKEQDMYRQKYCGCIFSKSYN
jgi:epoxyqueuosine reductase